MNLEAKIKAALTLSDAPETAKQRLTALATRLRRYSRESEAKKVSKESSKVYFQLFATTQ